MKELRPQPQPKLSEIINYLRNKNICLVGHASTVFKQPHNIDDFDVVCRCNTAYPEIYSPKFNIEKYVPFIGKRTDIIFSSGRGVRQQEVENILKPKFMIRTRFHKNAKFMTDWFINHSFCYDPWRWSLFSGEVDFNPTTGFLAMFILYHMVDFKSLTLFGFNFYETNNWEKPTVIGNHDPFIEKRLVSKMIKLSKKSIKIIEDSISNDEREEVKKVFEIRRKKSIENGY